MQWTNLIHRAGDSHIQTNAETISEIGEHAQRVLGLKVAAREGALGVEDRGGKVKRFFTSFTSVDVKVIGTGVGIGRQSPDGRFCEEMDSHSFINCVQKINTERLRTG